MITPLPWIRRPDNKDVDTVAKSYYSSRGLAAMTSQKGVMLLPYTKYDIDFILEACNNYYYLCSLLAEAVVHLDMDLTDERKLIEEIAEYFGNDDN